jgi:hypothetical protein
MENLIIESIQQELERQTKRQIARLFNDLKGFTMPKLVEDRIKEAFYEVEFEVKKTIKQESGQHDQKANNPR